MISLRALVCAAGSSLVAAVSLGGSVFVPNASFEDSSAITPYGVSTAIASWTTYGDAPFDTGGGAYSSGTGIFPNVDYHGTWFDNADGAQLAFIFSKPAYVPFGRVGMEQILPEGTVYSAGKAYVLAVDVGLAQAAPGTTEPLTINLFYYDPLSPATRTVVGGRTIYNDASTSLSGSTLSTIEVMTPVLSESDAAVGKRIGIEFYTALYGDAGAQSGKQYDLDNVRVNEVPEPASLALPLLGAGLMALRRKRASR